MEKPKQRSKLRPNKKKLHTRAQCLSLAQKLCKYREYVKEGSLECISCGKTLILGETTCQGGHYISRKDVATETEPDNLWPQCSVCNVLLSGNIPMFRWNLVKRIGEERVRRLELMSLARKGSAEAKKELSASDYALATMKKSARYYDDLYHELKEELKNYEQQL